MKRLALLLLVGCGDSAIGGPDAAGAQDATPDTTMTVMDSGMMQGDADAAVMPFVPPVPFAVPMSMMGPDQLMSVVPGPAGTFFAAGFSADTAAGKRYVVVVKLKSNGLDTTWGTNGIVKTMVEFAGGADEIDIVAQSTGKLVVSTTIPNIGNPADRDVALFRLDTTGMLDTTFGTNGIATLDLNTALDAAQSAQRDASRGLEVGANDILYVHAATRGAAQRTDSDFAVVRLTANGTVDTSFATQGKFTLDFGTPSANATPRGLHVLPNGSIIVSGYASSSISNMTTQPVLYKLTSAGVLDTAFADNGLYHTVVLALQTEIYNFAVHGNFLATGGYGRNTGTTNDWISLHIDAVTGAKDTKWAGKLDGNQLFDPSNMMLGSNCRGAFALPGGKIIMIGSTGPSNMPAQDAVFAILDATGALDKAYGNGVHLLPFGSGMGGNDQLWGAAVSGTTVLAVGWKGAGAMQTDQANDDAYAISFPLQ